MSDMERLYPLLQELGNAINDTLNDSRAIAETVGKIKAAGFDAFLVLEATIAFQKRYDAPSEPVEVQPKVKSGNVVRGTFSEDDEQLLRELKIRLK